MTFDKFLYWAPHSNKEPLQEDVILAKLNNSKGPIGVDIETVSLEDRRILGVGFALNRDEAYYFRWGSPDLPEHILTNNSILKVFYNVGFDIRTMQEQGLDVVGYADAMEADKIEGTWETLADLAKRYYDWDWQSIEDLIGTKPKKKGDPPQLTLDQVDEVKLGEKCMWDARATLAYWQDQEVSVPALELETAILPKTLAMMNRGMMVDKTRLDNYRTQHESDYEYLKRYCTGLGFNPGSGKQVAAYLQMQGHRIYYNRKTWNPRMDEFMLKEVYKDEPISGVVLQYRHIQQLLTHFFRKIDSLIGPDGRVRPNLHQTGAASGRYSSSSPNVQNNPEAIRDVWIPTPGYLFADWDLNQIELRWLAYLSQDPEMVRIFANGEDIHQGTADALNITRRRAKDCNFAIVYGGDENTLYQRSRIPIDEGVDLLAHHRDIFPGVWVYLEELKNSIRAAGMMTTFLGRVRHAPGIKQRIEMEASGVYKPSEIEKQVPDHMVEAEIRELVNHKIQGSAAETLKAAMLQTWEARSVNTIHDEELSEILPGEEPVLPNRPFSPFDTRLKIKVGHNWRDLVEVGFLEVPLVGEPHKLDMRRTPVNSFTDTWEYQEIVRGASR